MPELVCPFLPGHPRVFQGARVEAVIGAVCPTAVNDDFVPGEGHIAVRHRRHTVGQILQKPGGRLAGGVVAQGIVVAADRQNVVGGVVEELVGDVADVVQVVLEGADGGSQLLRRIGELGLDGLLMQDVVQGEKDHAKDGGDDQILHQPGQPHSEQQFISHLLTSSYDFPPGKGSDLSIFPYFIRTFRKKQWPAAFPGKWRKRTRAFPCPLWQHQAFSSASFPSSLGQ